MQRHDSKRSGGLLGRRQECAALDDLIAGVKGGGSGCLVLLGEAGIGKTALLAYAQRRAGGCRVARASGVEAEAELAFGGLHQLCAPFRDHFTSIPAPQRGALETAFGLTAGPPPDRFLVGLAVLSLFAEVADDQPLVCLVDDAQWLDQVSLHTLAFVARRLVAERTLVLFATRPTDHRLVQALPHLEVGGLGDYDARALLGSVRPRQLDERIRDRILAEAGGNPLALLELPRSLTSAEPTGTYRVPKVQPLASQLEQGFQHRLATLSLDAQRLLLVAAAEPVGDVVLVRRAAEQLGIDVDAAATETEAADLVTLRHMIRFRHPLVRSAAYRSARPEDRQEAHRVLAEATDPDQDPDRRVWHLASAAPSADEQVAAGLAEAAARAQARGGVAAAAAFLDRAAQLTPDLALRGSRALAAAQAKSQAGAYAEAIELLDGAQLSPLDARDRAQADLVRGQLMFAFRSASAGLPLLLSAAHRLEHLDPTLAKQTYRDAMYAAFTAGQLPAGEGLEDVAAAVRAMAAPDNPTRSDLLLEGVARVYTDGYAAAAPLVQQALDAYRTEGASAADLSWLPLAGRMAHNFWDFSSWSAISAALVTLARDAGALAVLSPAYLLRLSNRVYAGDLTAAKAMVEEAATIADVTGSSSFAHYGALVVVPWTGDEAATRAAIETIINDPLLNTEGKVMTATEWAAAVLYNGLSRWEDALAAAERGAAYPKEMGLSFASLVELTEAAARLNQPDRAKSAVNQLTEMAHATGTDWALGTAAYASALVSDDRAAEEHYREAVDRLECTDVGMQRARAYLVYGEWLARVQRTTEARRALARAYDLLAGFGASGFAERARRGLAGTGASTPPPTRDAVRPKAAALTSQESQIARMAADGLTNHEIGARLYLSGHTVEWHLRKVFAKLGIRSRRDIRAVLADDVLA